MAAGWTCPKCKAAVSTIDGVDGAHIGGLCGRCRRQALIDQAVRKVFHPAFFRHNYKGYAEELAIAGTNDVRSEFRRLAAQ